MHFEIEFDLEMFVHACAQSSICCVRCASVRFLCNLQLKLSTIFLLELFINQQFHCEYISAFVWTHRVTYGWIGKKNTITSTKLGDAQCTQLELSIVTLNLSYIYDDESLSVSSLLHYFYVYSLFSLFYVYVCMHKETQLMRMCIM